jgi:hypothetical protein
MSVRIDPSDASNRGIGSSRPDGMRLMSDGKEGFRSGGNHFSAVSSNLGWLREDHAGHVLNSLVFKRTQKTHQEDVGG